MEWHGVNLTRVCFLCLTDNGLNGDLSEEERSGSELGEDGDSMDSDKVGALNLVTSNERLTSHNNHASAHHIIHPTKNGTEKSNGHGQLTPPSGTPSAASVQAAFAAQVNMALLI